MKKILFVEPFYGGSHKQLIDTLTGALPKCCDYDLISLNAKKWPWRARCSALTLSQMVPKDRKYEILFCSSVLSLAEFLGLRPDLQFTKKIIYFHENQLIYPKQQIKKRDFQFGYNQITSCLAADIIIYNSTFNMNSFLDNINKFLKIMPDCRPAPDIRTQILLKAQVLYFPININIIPIKVKTYDTLHIIWPHRWEFDKGPMELFEILYKLKELNAHFKISILGEIFTDVPDVFHQAKESLKDHILHWGYAESKQEYYDILNTGHIVLSTAKHEFYGVAVLEAVYCGCYPLVPNSLVYPEIYDAQCLYKATSEVVNTLKELSENVSKVKLLRNSLSLNLSNYSLENLLPKYTNLLL